jgi:hypothetical protein
MLAMFLIDELLEKTSGSAFEELAYFFCDNTTAQRNSTIFILKSILHQILRKVPGIFYLTIYKSKGLRCSPRWMLFG